VRGKTARKAVGVVDLAQRSGYLAIRILRVTAFSPGGRGLWRCPLHQGQQSFPDGPEGDFSRNKTICLRCSFPCQGT
jgi:hypothetical protein